MREEIIKALSKTKDYISGEELSKELNVSRTTVWNYIKSLRKEGYEIIAKSNKGYKLILNSDKFLPAEFLTGLDDIESVRVFDSIDSTNIYCKENHIKLKDRTLVIAKEQINGRGRLGRKWISSKGQGIYFSLVLKPEMALEEAFMFNQVIALSIINVINKYLNKNTLEIKWPNDIIINNKKIAGILTETSGELEKVDYIIIGVGINLNNKLMDIKANNHSLYKEVESKIAFVNDYSKEEIDEKNLIIDIVNDFIKVYNVFLKERNLSFIIDDIKKHSAVIGKDIYVIDNKSGEKLKAKAIGITERGFLKLRIGDDIKVISSGEISIRGLDGYL